MKKNHVNVPGVPQITIFGSCWFELIEDVDNDFYWKVNGIEVYFRCRIASPIMTKEGRCRRESNISISSRTKMG